jgi:RecA-family ATPase
VVDDRARDDFAVEPFTVIDPLGWQGKPIPVREWIWQEWIPTRVVTMLSGHGGAGKSQLAQQLITSCAAGKPFLGFEVKRCRAIGVFCEDDADELHRRQAAINTDLGIEFDDLENLQLISRVGLDNFLMVYEADGRGKPTPFFHQLFALAKETGAQLIVIDTSADVFGGNEIVRSQVRQFIGLLARLAAEIDGAVVLLAHPSLAGLTSGRGESGSTAWHNTVRSRLYLEVPDAKMEEAAEIESDVRVLARVKANYAARGRITLRRDRGVFVLEAGGDTAGDRGRASDAERAFLAGLAELQAQQHRVNWHKGQPNYAPRMVRQSTHAAAGFSVEELTNAMYRLIKRGRLKSVEEGPKSRRRSYLVVIAPDLPGI